MKEKKKKILFAAVDVGFRIELYSRFIEKHYSDKLVVESLSVYALPEQHYKTKYTYQFNYHQKSNGYRWRRSFLNFLMCLFRYDIFHFISGETLLTRKLRGVELFIYKLLGKRIVFQFVGADIRSPEYIAWKEKNMKQFLAGQTDFPKSLPWQKKLIRDAVKYADRILVSTPDLLALFNEYTQDQSKVSFYPVMLDIEKFLAELNQPLAIKKDQDEIIILHSPSNIKVANKGTSFIYETLKKIVSDGEYKIKLILPHEKKENDGMTNYPVTRYQLFNHYKEADIVIDQMIIGWYGLQSVEALMAGKQVICYIDEQLKKFLFPGSPIKTADINSLENTVIDCIENTLTDRKKSETVMQQRDWVKEYHTIENHNGLLLGAWGIH